MLPHPVLYMGAGDSYSGPHTFTASALFTEPVYLLIYLILNVFVVQMQVCKCQGHMQRPENNFSECMLTFSLLKPRSLLFFAALRYTPD